jgi:hypothetical protein
MIYEEIIRKKRLHSEIKQTVLDKKSYMNYHFFSIFSSSTIKTWIRTSVRN